MRFNVGDDIQRLPGGLLKGGIGMHMNIKICCLTLRYLCATTMTFMALVTAVYAGNNELVDQPLSMATAEVDTGVSAASYDYPPYPGDPQGKAARVEVSRTALNNGLREFAFSTTQTQRDNTPQQRQISERAGLPQVHSGSPLFDGLFAMALDDLQLNSVESIESGVTAAVKQVQLSSADGKAVATGIVQMPNIEDRDNQYPWRDSTEFVVALKPGTYQLSFSDFLNMSYLQANKTYTGAGGLDGPVNKVDIAALKISRLH